MYCWMTLKNPNETTFELQHPILVSLLEDRQNQVGESTASETKMMNGEIGFKYQERKKKQDLFSLEKR